jgi:hypothetical protein
MPRPILKQYRDLLRADFERAPVWVCVHGLDDVEPWYDETDELTYRPWDGALPFPRPDPEGPMTVVWCDFTLADTSRLPGFCVPPVVGSDKSEDLSYTHPQLFLPDGTVTGFWFGAAASVADKARVYAALRKRAAEVFPIRYGAAAGVVTPPFELSIPGFSWFGPDYRTVVVER